jgi:RNA 2',3'-cyclic 3'-phosphodiesterase
MRLFYALWPDPTIQRALAEWARSCHGLCGGRAIPAEKLHVTVAFIGEVRVECFPQLIDIGGAAAASVAACDLTFDRIAYWRHNRIVYAAADAIPAALATLACRLNERLADAGLPHERRPFIPHVTLLRDARRAPGTAQIDPLAWRVRALQLVETIRPQGKHGYHVRESWTLAR